MDDFKNKMNQADELTRRNFLKNISSSLLGVSIASLSPVSKLLASERDLIIRRRPTAKNVIYLFMSGGMSHLDTFDPKIVDEVKGPLNPIKTNVAGIELGGWMPQLSEQMDKIALIRSMNSNQGAHEPGRYFMRTSYQKRATIIHPTLGSWLMKLDGKKNQTLPGQVIVDGASQHPGAGYLESQYAPLAINDPKKNLRDSTLPKGVSPKRFEKRLTLLEQMNADFSNRYNHKEVRNYQNFYDDALKLMRSDDLKAFDVSLESNALRQEYGNSNFGSGCLLARRLVEHGVRFVEVTLGGWDTHNNNFEEGADQAAILDKALTALLKDLYVRGMLEETLIVLATEFGRTPTINNNNGRDHYPKAFSCMMAGGGIRGGVAYGKTDERGASIIENPVTIPDFNATIAWALGLPFEKEMMSPSGRPFKIADKGSPLKDLFV